MTYIALEFHIFVCESKPILQKITGRTKNHMRNLLGRFCSKQNCKNDPTKLLITCFESELGLKNLKNVHLRMQLSVTLNNFAFVGIFSNRLN